MTSEQTEQKSTFVFETVHVTTGGTVHLGMKINGVLSSLPNCGAGQHSRSAHRFGSTYKLTTQPVTCKKCLKTMGG